ncbi:MAG: YceH family protein [Pyrinomonadaceae bacterium]|nr:YceH family protein [Pyrinomonadaceae bacterium]
MNKILDEVEARVIGCLIEKEATTPDNYPLTVNSLINACNQKTNRFPVVDYNEETVTNALDSLRDKNLVYVFFGGSSRVAKYKHLFPKIMDLSYPEVALMCVLMLRGPQTPGEIKSRTARLYGFGDINHVDETLRALQKREEPLVVNTGRQPGQKESRYAHLLCGEVEVTEQKAPIVRTVSRGSDELSEKLDKLRADFDQLKEEFEQFKSQFD